MLIRASLCWVLLMVVAIALGAIRESLLVPYLGAARGHVFGTLGLCFAVVLTTLALIRWLHPKDEGDAWRIGLLWAGLVIAFEFLAGHFVFGTPWGQLLADYDVFRGRVWILVPFTSAVAPRLATRLRRM